MTKSQTTIWPIFFLGSCNIWRYIKKSKNLDTDKASQQTDIPTKILKHNSDYFTECFCGKINQRISKSMFPQNLKLADVTPVYIKKSTNSKDNYRPVTILSNTSKIEKRKKIVDNSGAFGALSLIFLQYLVVRLMSF